MTEKTYTQEEVETLAVALKERQETLEALECARIVMTETRQYPRFIARLDFLIRSIEGSTGQEVNERVEHINNKSITEPKEQPKPAPTLIEPKKK